VLEVLPKIAKMQASYMLGRPLANPMNLTISVSYRCNSRCKTCNVWQRPNDDFTLEEYDKTFASIGRDAYWFTFSGGEPRLRKDLPEIVEAAYRHCRPGIINIPTNGIQDKIIPARIERVLQAAPTSDVIVNLSLDGVGEKHDIVRGVKGNFERAIMPSCAILFNPILSSARLPRNASNSIRLAWVSLHLFRSINR
jgi:MoaA/NifB/PqqE/SkfB family radical SAM enzyme